jgi:hypothetical protein
MAKNNLSLLFWHETQVADCHILCCTVTSVVNSPVWSNHEGNHFEVHYSVLRLAHICSQISCVFCSKLQLTSRLSSLNDAVCRCCCYWLKDKNKTASVSERRGWPITWNPDVGWVADVQELQNSDVHITDSLLCPHPINRSNHPPDKLGEFNKHRFSNVGFRSEYLLWDKNLEFNIISIFQWKN